MMMAKSHSSLKPTRVCVCNDIYSVLFDAFSLNGHVYLCVI